jgi:hypothetical protein
MCQRFRQTTGDLPRRNPCAGCGGSCCSASLLLSPFSCTEVDPQHESSWVEARQQRKRQSDTHEPDWPQKDLGALQEGQRTVAKKREVAVHAKRHRIQCAGYGRRYNPTPKQHRAHHKLQHCGNLGGGHGAQQQTERCCSHVQLCLHITPLCLHITPCTRWMLTAALQQHGTLCDARALRRCTHHRAARTTGRTHCNARRMRTACTVAAGGDAVPVTLPCQRRVSEAHTVLLCLHVHTHIVLPDAIQITSFSCVRGGGM